MALCNGVAVHWTQKWERMHSDENFPVRIGSLVLCNGRAACLDIHIKLLHGDGSTPALFSIESKYIIKTCGINPSTPLNHP